MQAATLMTERCCCHAGWQQCEGERLYCDPHQKLHHVLCMVMDAGSQSCPATVQAVCAVHGLQ